MMKQLKLPNVSEGSAMSALLNEDERALRDAVRSFLDKKVAPLVAAHEGGADAAELLPQLYDSATSGRGAWRPGETSQADDDGGDPHGGGPLLKVAAHHRQRAGHGRPRARRGADADQAERFLRPLLEGRRFGWFGADRARRRLRTPGACGPRPGAPGTATSSTAASSTSPTPSAATSAFSSPAWWMRTARITG